MHTTAGRRQTTRQNAQGAISAVYSDPSNRRTDMRVISWLAAAVALSLATPVLAQEEWDNFKFPEDGFEVNFPGKPQVQTTTWMSQYRYNLPAKIYSATH